ncbi:hypothetical protein FOL47_010964 [Perkinsus chesapeaki]|uniref:Uncharacterized protein n=1 Tax=Perkinsus chesapeaki TaxID=330153 RepID=A0A7J6N1J5_PERCH|nr:hypothetical protein FOL47_010964 [Perkinsus chesapeaki]
MKPTTSSPMILFAWLYVGITTLGCLPHVLGVQEEESEPALMKALGGLALSVLGLHQASEPRLLEGGDDGIEDRPPVSNDTSFDIYFSFVPRYFTTLLGNNKYERFEGLCFKEISISSQIDENGFIITLDLAKPVSLFCTETLLFGNVDKVVSKTYLKTGRKSLKWRLGGRNAAEEKVYAFGLRVPLSRAIRSVASTVTYLKSRRYTMGYLSRFAGISLNKRHPSATEHIPSPTEVASGDILVLLREEGKASMIAWNSGSLIDHVVIIVREPETGEPYVIESFGPTRVRKVLYTEYIKQYADKYHNMVYLPLKEEHSKVFNAKKAWHLFADTFEGYEYGWENFFFAWLDTKEGNYPCLPLDNFETCFTWQAAEVFLGFLDRHKLTKPLAEKYVLQGFRHRLNTTEKLNMSQIVKIADKKIEGGAAVLATMPEEDHWLYDTHRFGKKAKGPARVCSSLTCEMLRAGGALGDKTLRCSEFTPFETYSLDIFDGSRAIQLSGRYTLNLSEPYVLRMGQKTVYDHMGEHCESRVTKDSFYYRTPGC